MGGTIKVVLVTPDGQTYKMNRWTNTLPDFVVNLNFIKKSADHIHSYMEAWMDMRNDWEKNGPNGPFEHNMTRAYFPNDEEMVPEGYGLVVLDMEKNKIFSMQGYSGVDTIYYNERFGMFDRDRKERFEALEQEGRTSVKHDFGDGSLIIYQVDMSPFVVKVYDETATGAKQMFEDLKMEYILSDDEILNWEAYIRHQIELETPCS